MSMKETIENIVISGVLLASTAGIGYFVGDAHGMKKEAEKHARDYISFCVDGQSVDVSGRLGDEAFFSVDVARYERMRDYALERGTGTQEHKIAVADSMLTDKLHTEANRNQHGANPFGVKADSRFGFKGTIMRNPPADAPYNPWDINSVYPLLYMPK